MICAHAIYTAATQYSNRINNMKNLKTRSLMCLLFISLSVCIVEPACSQQNVESIMQTTLERFTHANPAIQRELQQSPGYAVIDWQANSGKGTLVIRAKKQRHAITLSRFELGPHWRGRAFHALIVFATKDYLDKLKPGKFRFVAGVNIPLDSTDKNIPTPTLNPDFTIYILNKNNTVETAIARSIQMQID